MKTRNLMTIFTVAFVVSIGTAFFVPSAEAGSFPKFNRPAQQVVRERVERHDGDRNRSYTYERWERNRAPAPRENRREWEHRERYGEPRYGHYDGGHRSCDNASHRHWGRHWHDDHGHAHFFFAWGLLLPGLYIGF